MNLKTLRTFIQKNNKDEFNRYKSWEHCYHAFGRKRVDADTLAVQLAFYLASWGMYRGSSGLLYKDYRIHIEPVNYILEYKKSLRCSKGNEVGLGDIKKIMELKKKLSAYYAQFSFVNNKRQTKKIKPTATLISKILLGSLGCVPAFDRIYSNGLKTQGLNMNGFQEKKLKELFTYIEKHEAKLLKFQTDIEKEFGVYYPFCKIIDAYFWQIGQQKDIDRLNMNRSQTKYLI